jgi:hypothetical protein
MPFLKLFRIFGWTGFRSLLLHPSDLQLRWARPQESEHGLPRPRGGHCQRLEDLIVHNIYIILFSSGFIHCTLK